MARGERVALLAPTVKAAQQFEAVVQNWELDFQTIYDEDDFLSKSLILMPISLAKGLEFDVAVGIGTADSLADLSKESYHQIWYTIFSRAMHELYVVVSNDQSPLLDGIDESTYQVN